MPPSPHNVQQSLLFSPQPRSLGKAPPSQDYFVDDEICIRMMQIGLSYLAKNGRKSPKRLQAYRGRKNKSSGIKEICCTSSQNSRSTSSRLHFTSNWKKSRTRYLAIENSAAFLETWKFFAAFFHLGISFERRAFKFFTADVVWGSSQPNDF